MTKVKTGKDVVIGQSAKFGENVVIWNYVVIGAHTLIGSETVIGSFCDVGKEVTIGKKCNLQAHVTISNGCKIGNNVFIAPNSSLLNDKYPVSKALTPPVIEDDAIIGGGVTVLPNIIVGEGSIVAAGSVVTKDVAARTVVRGVPAKVVMTREQYENKRNAFVKSHVTVEK